MLGATADEALGRLLADGFVDIVSRTVGPAPVAVAAPAAAPPAPARVDVATLRRTAVRDLTDLVGPMGEAAALRIERAKTLDELRAALTLAAQIVANSRGRPAAEAFAARHGLI
jgi:hypothetical protein